MWNYECSACDEVGEGDYETQEDADLAALDHIAQAHPWVSYEE